MGQINSLNNGTNHETHSTFNNSIFLPSSFLSNWYQIYFNTKIIPSNNVWLRFGLWMENFEEKILSSRTDSKVVGNGLWLDQFFWWWHVYIPDLFSLFHPLTEWESHSKRERESLFPHLHTLDYFHFPSIVDPMNFKKCVINITSHSPFLVPNFPLSLTLPSLVFIAIPPLFPARQFLKYLF